MFDKNKIKYGLSFDDVLIVPKYSDISSRKQISTKTRFSRNIKLNIPIVSANMDTVTESQMAIAMARQGGIGIIHRFMPLERQISEITKVKRAESFVIKNPIIVSKQAKLSQALELMDKYKIGGLLVVDKNKYLQGIITARDVRFQDDKDVLVSSIMTNKQDLICASPNVKESQAKKIFLKHKTEKLPLIDRQGKLKGLITSADFIKKSQYINSVKDKSGRLIVGAAIGLKQGMSRTKKLVKAGANVIVIDIAHGHHKKCLELLTSIKTKYKNTIDVVAGNICTQKAAKDLILAGADALKVGIGPGAACSTRSVAGAGVPQITAITDTAKVASRYNIPIISDGGIRVSGHLAKAIGAGASSVMIGSLLAGTEESPGKYFIDNGAVVKIYRGLASRDVSIEREHLEGNKKRPERTPEGISARIAYKGKVDKILQSLIDGLQSGMSYSGSKNIVDFWQKAEFIVISKAGQDEGSVGWLKQNNNH
ncbi:IMP dehydrogenase [Patescibacteria group bacterium]|nr:IMP dehydrogenase [Patescibacteria group bacterium]